MLCPGFVHNNYLRYAMENFQQYLITPYIPHPSLKDYIIAYAYTELNTTSLANMDLFPCGITTLVVMLSGNTEITSVQTGKNYRDKFYFVGQYSLFTPFYSTKARAITITFKPFGAHALFGVPQHLSLDQNIEAAAIFPEIKDILPQLEDLSEYPQECIRLIDKFFLTKISRKIFADPRINYACDIVAKSKGSTSIKDLANSVSMSPRSLELHFREKVGMSPKLFSRIIRFSNAVQYIKNSKKIDWQDVSYRFGYFDQNHFIREFKHFFGATPTQIQPDTHSIAFFVAEKISESRGS